MTTDVRQDRPLRTDGGRVVRVEITPVAFRDPPLLNAVGVHEPYALRSVVQVHTDAGDGGRAAGHRSPRRPLGGWGQETLSTRAVSSASSASVRSDSGGRTRPPSRPTAVRPALTMETA